jgi:hypothetical protein
MDPGVVIHLLLVLLTYSVLKRIRASTLRGVAGTIGKACIYLKKLTIRAWYSVQAGS